MAERMNSTEMPQHLVEAYLSRDRIEVLETERSRLVEVIVRSFYVVLVDSLAIRL